MRQKIMKKSEMTPHQIELNNVRQARYRLTDKCKATKARYRATEKGKATDKKHDLKQRGTEKRKNYLKMHEQLPKTKAVRKAYRASPESKENTHTRSLMRFYNITKEEYNKLFEKQTGRCAICFSESKIKLSVDHCHKTGRVRGLLCRKCNLGIGFLKDSVEFLNKAIKYLQ